MSFVFLSSSVAPSVSVGQYKVHNLQSQKISSKVPNLCYVHCRFSRHNMESTSTISRNKFSSRIKFMVKSSIDFDNQMFGDSFEFEDMQEVDNKDLESPWDGAIIYKRDASINHVEYCTTLERLGMERLSTDISKSRASAMGIRVTKAVKDYPNGTPVQISVDITRRKKKLRLDGIVKTVITLGCNRCAWPAAKNIFSNFSILLTEEPVEEPEFIDKGTIFHEDKFKSTSSHHGNVDKEDIDDASIDWDDRLYFPPGEKEIDISKNIRDLVHLEITIDQICKPSCKGLCLNCGANMNFDNCTCSEEELPEGNYGPLGNLKEQMEAKNKV